MAMVLLPLPPPRLLLLLLLRKLVPPPTSSVSLPNRRDLLHRRKHPRKLLHNRLHCLPTTTTCKLKLKLKHSRDNNRQPQLSSKKTTRNTKTMASRTTRSNKDNSQWRQVPTANATSQPVRVQK